MEIQRIGVGQRLSEMVVAGDLLFIAGQVDDQHTTCADQAAAILAQLDKLLAQAGSSRTKLLSASVWLADIADYDTFNRLWDAWVPAGAAPTRVCVQATLAKPQFRVEVAAVAARG